MKRMLAVIICIFLVAALLPSVFASAADEVLDGEYVLDEIIIKFRDKSEFPDKEKQYDDEVAKILKDGLSKVTENTYVIKAEDLAKNPNAVLNRYKNSAFIEYAEPNYIATGNLFPNDPDYKIYTQKAWSSRNLEGMWDIVSSSPAVVAVLDTGVYADHTDFGGRVLGGYDFVNNKAGSAADDNGHGTGVAGVIAAQGNNGSGAAGINWGAVILPVKVLDSKGSGSVANIAKGIMWAADNGAKILNMSFGTTSNSITLKASIDYAAAKGCILVAASGNSGKNAVEYPARYDSVIGVGAETGTGARDNITCYGAGLDILAIGSYRTTTRSGGYGTAAGTSFSAPQVAGALSLALVYSPELDTYGAIDLIAKAAVGNGWSETLGYGYIDFEKLVETAQAQSGEKQPEDKSAPVLRLLGDTRVELTEGDTYSEPGWVAEDDTDGNLTSSVIVAGSVATAYAGVYELTYTVSDRAGNTASAVRTVVVAEPPAPQEDVPVPPAITAVGSNPIILHLGGSPYVEQGAVAFDAVDGDISASVTVSGAVDTTAAGTYYVTYSVVNSAGLEASVTREVRVLAPLERYSERTPYNFNDQGKSGASFSHTVCADASGMITLSVSGLNKTSVTVSVTGAGGQVFSESFSGNASRDFWVSEGDYTVSLTIDSANGNAKVGLSLLMPEVLEIYFTEAEVPRSEFPLAEGDGAAPATGDGAELILTLAVLVLSAAGASAVLLSGKKKAADG